MAEEIGSLILANGRMLAAVAVEVAVEVVVLTVGLGTLAKPS